MGADAVVLAGHSVDPYNGKCLRASAGSIFSIPVLELPTSLRWSLDCGGAVCRCWRRRWTAKSPRRRWIVDPPTAWLFGSEAHGLSAEVAALADRRVASRWPAAPRA